MSPPPAAVEIGSPPLEKVSPFFPESVGSRDQPSMDRPSSSFSTEHGLYFGFGAGSGEKTKSRHKPRLVKLRKNGRKVKGTSFSGETPSGFNPFAPPPPSKGSVHVNGINEGDSRGEKDKAFVFGVNGNSCGAKDTPSPGNPSVTPGSDEEEFSTPVGDFVFGSESTPCNGSRSSEVDSGKTGSESCILYMKRQ